MVGPLAYSLHVWVASKPAAPTSNCDNILWSVSNERSEKDIFVVSLTSDLKLK